MDGDIKNALEKLQHALDYCEQAKVPVEEVVKVIRDHPFTEKQFTTDYRQIRKDVEEDFMKHLYEVFKGK